MRSDALLEAIENASPRMESFAEGSCQGQFMNCSADEQVKEAGMNEMMRKLHLPRKDGGGLFTVDRDMDCISTRRSSFAG